MRLLDLDLWDVEMDFENMPPNVTTHFEPTPEFLDWFADKMQDEHIFEVGAGQCKFSEALVNRGVRVMAIEPRVSDETLQRCSNFVLPMAMQKVSVIRECPVVIVVARPDHSGWFRNLLDIAHPQSRIIYIGLDKNLRIDIPDTVTLKTLYVNAGEDDENVYEVIR